MAVLDLTKGLPVSEIKKKAETGDYEWTPYRVLDMVSVGKKKKKKIKLPASERK